MNDLSHIKAEVILHSKNLLTGRELVTLELEYPRYIHCFDEETEVLCKESNNDTPLFRKFKDIQSGDYYIAQVDESFTVSFIKPTAYIKKYISEDVVSFNNTRLDFKVTKEHRLLVGSRKSKGYYHKEVILAKDLMGSFTTKRFYKKGDLVHNSRSEQYPPLVKLIAYFVSDGTSTKNQAIFHLKKERKIKEVSRLLELCDIQYRKTSYKDGTTNIVFSKPGWVDECYTLDRKKKLPDNLWNMDKKSFEWFKQGLLESDGCINNNEFNNNSEILIDQLQAIFHINDISFNKRKYGDLFKVSFLTEDSPVLRRDKHKPILERYEGYVYCVTVPTGLIMVRRNGIVHISGNCELMTHRVFSRNASSSRAIPVEKAIASIEKSNWYPIFMKNKKGMAATEELDGFELKSAIALWGESKRSAILTAKHYKILGVHKQIANRILEPYSLIKVILTATDFDNFFKLRLASGAQQEIQELARKMKDAIESSTPQGLSIGDWHIPYIFKDEEHISDYSKLKLSAARCARVSYLNHSGERDQSEDYALHDTLSLEGHWSPFEHQAVAMDLDINYANFRSFSQYRENFDFISGKEFK